MSVKVEVPPGLRAYLSWPAFRGYVLQIVIITIMKDTNNCFNNNNSNSNNNNNNSNKNSNNKEDIGH